MNRIVILTLLLFIVCIILYSCGSIRDTILQNYPDFEIQADKFEITGPFSPFFGINEYSVKNLELNKVHEMQLKLGTSSTKINKLDEENESGIHITKTEEITSHVFYVYDYIDSSVFRVEGELTYHRTKEEKGKSSYETRDIISLIEFQILEDDKNIGKISVLTSMSGYRDMVLPFEVLLHDNDYHIEYQNRFNKITVSLEKDFKLIALFGLKPKSFVTTRMIGDILIEKDLSEDTKSDIFSIFLMIEGILSNKDIGF